MQLEPGLHRISMAHYLALPYLNSGACNTILRSSPFHAKYEIDHPDSASVNTANMGTAAHDAILEGVDRIEVIDADSWRTKAAKEARDAALDAGRIPLLPDDAQNVLAMRTAVMEYIKTSEASGVFDQGEAELTIIWDEPNGVRCKARPDWLSADGAFMLHLKTTDASAAPTPWIRRQMASMGYDLVAMFYERGLATLRDQIPGDDGKQPATSVFLIAEQNPPFGCSLVGLSNQMADIASQKVERAITAWGKCLQAGRYPCYPSRIAYAEPTAWQATEAEQDRFTDEELLQGIPL